MPEQTQEFRLRFNTEYLKNNTVLPWRLLIWNDLYSYKEMLVKEITINVPSWTTVENLPEIGRKWQVGFRGVFTLFGNQALISPSPSNPATHFLSKMQSGKKIRVQGIVRINFNPRHVDFPKDTPPWQAIFGEEDVDTQWERIRVSHAQFNVPTLTTRTVLNSGAKWHFGGKGASYIETDAHGDSLIVY